MHAITNNKSRLFSFVIGLSVFHKEDRLCLTVSHVTRHGDSIGTDPMKFNRFYDLRKESHISRSGTCRDSMILFIESLYLRRKNFKYPDIFCPVRNFKSSTWHSIHLLRQTPNATMTSSVVAVNGCLPVFHYIHQNRLTTTALHIIRKEI